MIRELPLEVRSKIAAGEVIERPVSVVKELVENALDAGATDIKVSVINGGLDEIMVSDNGCGMPFEELPLAVKRFTTSKIGSVEDLDSIATLGFRGEALASIADVADLTIFSCDGETSGQLRIRGGELLLCKPVASPKGTRVIVRDLFFNLPARKKFLRSASTEFSHIQEVPAVHGTHLPKCSVDFHQRKRRHLACPTAVICGGAVLQLIWSKSPISCFHSFAGRIGHLFKPQHSWRTDFVCEWPTH